MTKQNNSAAKTYTLRMIGVFTLYTLTVVGINLIDRAFELSSAVRVGLALTPLISQVLFIATVISFLRSMDEVWQKIITESMLISALMVGLLTFTYGFLQGAIDLPDISLIWVWPALIAFQGIAMFFVKRYYS